MGWLWKRVWLFLKKLSIRLPHDPVVPFPDVYLKATKACVHWYKCQHLYTSAHSSFICESPNWKQPKCQSTDEEIVVYFTVKYYSAKKLNKLLIHPSAWMNLKIMMLGEKKSRKKVCMFCGFTY